MGNSFPGGFSYKQCKCDSSSRVPIVWTSVKKSEKKSNGNPYKFCLHEIVCQMIKTSFEFRLSAV